MTETSSKATTGLPKINRKSQGRNPTRHALLSTRTPTPIRATVRVAKKPEIKIR
jgi:hypothetical protein